MAGAFQIEVVRGVSDDALAAELLAFWERTVGFTGDAARARIPEVMAVVRQDGALAGVSSVFVEEIGGITGVQLHVLRTLLPGDADLVRDALISEVFAALDAEYDGAPDSVAGLCVLCRGTERRARPEAVWSDPPLAHAGYLEDGRQVRVAYYDDGFAERPRTDPGEERYRILEWRVQDELGAAEVAAMWVREGVLTAEQAAARAAELIAVAVDGSGRPVGACTGFVGPFPQLGGEYWHVRMFVAAAHRRSHVSEQLGDAYRGYLTARFAAGEEPAIGIVYEVQNPALIRHPPRGVWPSGPFLYMTTTPSGSQVRVHYFPGARAPEPD